MVNNIEEFVKFNLPKQYLAFVKTLNSPYEIPTTPVTLYSLADLLERNTTYDIQAYEPESLLIGQEGDLGFFIRKNHGEKIFELGLGALGSLEMRIKGDNIFDFMEKIKADYEDMD